MEKEDRWLDWAVELQSMAQALGGAFEENAGTVESGYFGSDELPGLAEEKNNREQIRMCFEAYREKHWDTVFD